MSPRDIVSGNQMEGFATVVFLKKYKMQGTICTHTVYFLSKPIGTITSGVDVFIYMPTARPMGSNREKIASILVATSSMSLNTSELLSSTIARYSAMRPSTVSATKY